MSVGHSLGMVRGEMRSWMWEIIVRWNTQREERTRSSWGLPVLTLTASHADVLHKIPNPQVLYLRSCSEVKAKLLVKNYYLHILGSPSRKGQHFRRAPWHSHCAGWSSRNTRLRTVKIVLPFQFRIQSRIPRLCWVPKEIVTYAAFAKMVSI